MKKQQQQQQQQQPLVTPYNCTKPGVIRKISFQTRNRKINLTILYNRYGSTGPKRSFWVLKRVKMYIFYNNANKTPYNGTKPGLMRSISFQTRNRKIYFTMLGISYGSTFRTQKDLFGPVDPYLLYKMVRFIFLFLV